MARHLSTERLDSTRPIDSFGPIGRPERLDSMETTVDEATAVGDAAGGETARPAGWRRRPATVTRSARPTDGDPVEPMGPAHHEAGVGAVVGMVVAAGLVLWALVSTIERAGWSTPSVPWLILVATAVAAVAASRLAPMLDRLHRAEADVAAWRHRAGLDPLTGLAGRDATVAELARRLADRGPGALVGVLICELERLQLVNDSIGHRAGDEVVRAAAERLVEATRSTEAVGRFGGGRFVVVASDLPAIRDLEILAERLADSLTEPIVVADGAAPVVSARLGLAFVSGDDPIGIGAPGASEAGGPDHRTHDGPGIDAAAAAELLVRDAGLALLRAREDGRDWAPFDRSLRAAAIERLELERGLRAALAAEEIEVHYQPVIQVATGRVDQVEALIRWRHPVRGMLLPSQFLAATAQTDLTVELGRIVLERACRQAAAWSTSLGRPISVSVNLDRRQLLDPDLVDRVSSAVGASGLAPGQLHLELSEDAVADRGDRSLAVLRRLRLLGVELVVDDLGSTQSALGRLRQLIEVSTVKLDRSLVTSMVTDPVDGRLVAAIVALADSLGLSVVATGVETAEQARALIDLGVDRLQGFLFDRPGAALAVEANLDTDHRSRW